MCFTRSKPTIAVLQLRGSISSSKHSDLSYKSVSKLLNLSIKTPNIKALAIIINSPGGEAVQSELIYNEIKELSIDHNIPVYAFIEDMAASGGYMIACAADEIYASNNSILGSIGVVTSVFGLQKVIEKLGIEHRLYTEGENKSILDPFSPEKESDVAIIKSLQKDIHDSFKTIVMESRKDKIDTEKDELFNGMIWSGKKALEIGLIDGIGFMSSKMKDIYGEDVEFRYIKEPSSFLGSLKQVIGFGTEVAIQSILAPRIKL
jgi:signal peptide peptidase SppA